LIGRRRSRIPLPLPENNNRARVNDKIRVPSVRLIDETGQQLGVVQIQEALSKAQAVGLDLVEVSPDAKPPVSHSGLQQVPLRTAEEGSPGEGQRA
jgi:hypothetical protein